MRWPTPTRRPASPAKAAAAEVRAADRAAAAGQAAAAAGYRLRAGAFLFQAGRFVEADAALSRVADDPAAGPVRPRAGMLRALARGRALAASQPGASMAAYTEALEQQLRDFPADPATDEARWLLGELAVARPPIASGPARSGRPSPPDRPAGSTPGWPSPRSTATSSTASSSTPTGASSPGRSRGPTGSWPRASARRDPRTPPPSSCWPAPGSTSSPPPAAPRPPGTSATRVGRLPVSPAVLYRARLLRMIALVELGRYVEAEREAQSTPTGTSPPSTRPCSTPSGCSTRGPRSPRPTCASGGSGWSSSCCWNRSSPSTRNSRPPSSSS